MEICQVHRTSSETGRWTFRIRYIAAVGCIALFVMAATMASPNPATAEDANIAIVNVGVGLTAYAIVLTGEITQSTEPQFLAALNDAKISRGLKSPPYFARPNVMLNSPGGDVIEAMKIGRAIRKANLGTFVGGKYECSSACVLILAAGVNRVADYGRVGIHRPRFDDAYFGNLTPDQAREKYGQMAELVRKYLVEMGISEQLYLDMVKISPDDVRYLSASEMQDYGLIGDDPAWMEYKRSAEINSTGRETYDENQAFVGVETACYNKLGIDSATCKGLPAIFRDDMETCVKSRPDRIACAKTVEDAMIQHLGP